MKLIIDQKESRSFNRFINFLILVFSVFVFILFLSSQSLTNFIQVGLLQEGVVLQNYSEIQWSEFYFTKDESEHLDCEGFLNGNVDKIDEYVNNGRMKLDKLKRFDIAMDCDSIRNRIYGDVLKFQTLPRTIAFVRNIYTLYELQETFLSMSYHPDNTYCYAIDSKSDNELKNRMRQMSTCFDNIIILKKEFDFDSAGHRQDRAHFECLQQILDRKWNHAILLQNYDMPIKTVSQISQLSQLLNYTSIMGMEKGIAIRYNTSADWSPASLKLFKNESEVSDEILYRQLKVKYGLNEVILSKIFVNSIFSKLNLELIFQLFDNNTFVGTDELFINTIYGNRLGLDGELESECLKPFGDEKIPRITHWNFNQKQHFDRTCKSLLKRHGICILGVEYLKELMNTSSIVANKVMEMFDFGTVICARRYLRQNKSSPLPDANFLRKLPQFREMEMKRDGKWNSTKIDC